MIKKKSRLVVRKGDEYLALLLDDVVFIHKTDSLVVVTDKHEKKYLSDKTLSQLETELDPRKFFRANRQYMINIQYIRSFKAYEKVKLEVFLKITHPDHVIIISQKTAPFFRKWIADEE